MLINSNDYWEIRFSSGDWESKKGREQTLFFARLIVENLPDWFIEEINRLKLTICDWGCAEGDAVSFFSKVFANSEISGVDISESAIEKAKKRFPAFEFYSVDIDNMKVYDVIISSNTLEHFFSPYDVAKRLSKHAAKYLVFLIPFQEVDRIEEHFYTFDYSNIPFCLDDFCLRFFKELDTKNMENTYWQGKQILLVYEKGLSYKEKVLSDLGVNDLSLSTDILKEKNEELKCKNNLLLKEKENVILQLEYANLEIKRLNEEKREKLTKAYAEIDDLEKQVKKLAEEKKELQQAIERTTEEKVSLEKILNDIYSSRLWKVANSWYKIKKGFKRYLNIKKSSNLIEKSGKNEDEYYIHYVKNLTLPKQANKYDVIFFSIIDWNFRFQRPQHIGTGLAKKGHRVFYLSVSFNKSNTYDIKRIVDNIYEVKLPYINRSAIYSETLLDGLELLKKSMADLIKKYSIKEHVYFVEFPMWYNLVKDLKDLYNQPIIFDVLDEFSGFKNVHKDIAEYEKKMLSISDAVISSSSLLCNKVKDSGKNCFLVRNGTEYRHFSKLIENDLLKEVKKPIIGYYGAISDWFDTELIEYAAKIHPDWSFVLIGHTFGADIKSLKKMKNVYFLGEKPYEELPKYLYWFDVCLIPFKNVPLIQSTNPVKFYEYISAGKPVVSTAMKELESFSDIAYIAKDKDDFVSKIEVALKEGKNSELIKKRKQVALENDWTRRVDEIDKIISKSFKRVSIIIVTYNNIDYTKMCIDSIFKYTAYPNYEVIIVDNNSTDGTREYLKKIEKEHKEVKIVLNDDNLGFAKANNIGIKVATGEYIILLNNDTVVTRGWISGLLRHFANSVGMVGPVTNSIGNEAKINVPYKNLDEMHAFAEYYTSKHFGESFKINVLAMFCVAIKREIIDKVGLLDERYGVGMFEDDDYAMAVRKAGYKLLCAEDVFIHHFGSATFKGLLKDKTYRRLFDENRKKFEEKWNVKWVPHKYRDGVS